MAEQVRDYEDVPKYEWDGESIIFSDTKNRYFDDADELGSYCFFSEVAAVELELYHCKPNYARPVYVSHFSEDLPEDEDEVPAELMAALDTFNASIKAYGKPLSWSPDYNRAVLLTEQGKAMFCP